MYYKDNTEDPFITLKDVCHLIRPSRIHRTHSKTHPYPQRKMQMKMSEKNSKFTPQTIFSSLPKLKMKSHSSRFLSTTNREKISMFTMTLCFQPFPSVSNGLIFLLRLPLPPRLHLRILHQPALEILLL